jgi:N-acetylmuramoyl-L-alanine amidase
MAPNDPEWLRPETRAALCKLPLAGTVIDCRTPDFTAKLPAAAPDRRTVIVLDPGHGGYWNTDLHTGKPRIDRNGDRENHYDPGSIHGALKEAAVTEAMAARMALKLASRGFAVRLTHDINWSGNALLQDLSANDTRFLALLNRASHDMLPDRYNARVETGRRAGYDYAAAIGQTTRAMYISLHAEVAATPGRHGVEIMVHRDLPTHSPAHHLAHSLRDAFADTNSLTNRPRFTTDKDGKRHPLLINDGSMQSILDAHGNPERGLIAATKQPIAPFPADGVREPGPSAVTNGLGARMPAVLIEFGKLNNAADAARLTSPEKASALADTAIAGIERYVAQYQSEMPIYPAPKAPAGRAR